MDKLKKEGLEEVTEAEQVEVIEEDSDLVESTNEEQTVLDTEEEEILDVKSTGGEASLISALEKTVFNKLTKKNQQYLMSVDKLLSDVKIEESTYRAVLLELADTLIEGQSSGQTAKHLYGTPTECANVIREQHFPTEQTDNQAPSEPWQIALDGALILGSIYTIMTGISLLNNNTSGIGIGLLTLLVNYLVAGVAMLLISQNLPNPRAPKGQKGYLKYFGMSTLAMISWVGSVSIVTAFAPSVINPLLPAPILLAIGGITLAARFYIKKRYNIRGGVF